MFDFMDGVLLCELEIHNAFYQEAECKTRDVLCEECLWGTSSSQRSFSQGAVRSKLHHSAALLANKFDLTEPIIYMPCMYILIISVFEKCRHFGLPRELQCIILRPIYAPPPPTPLEVTRTGHSDSCSRRDKPLPRYCSVKLGDINHCNLWKSNPPNYTYLPTIHSYAYRGPGWTSSSAELQCSSAILHPTSTPTPGRLRRNPVSGWWHTPSKRKNTTLNTPHHTGHSHPGSNSVPFCAICPYPPQLNKLWALSPCILCKILHIWAVSTLEIRPLNR